MNPDTVKLSLDIVVVLLGVYCIFSARKSTIGGVFGQAMTLILIGLLILTVNHILDTVWLANYLNNAGHAKDLLQGSIVHRYINLTGFILMAVGFGKISKK